MCLGWVREGTFFDKNTAIPEILKIGVQDPEMTVAPFDRSPPTAPVRVRAGGERSLGRPPLPWAGCWRSC